MKKNKLLAVISGVAVLFLITGIGIACCQTSIPSVDIGYYKIPDWVKHVAEWWTDGQITDDSFMKEMAYLINHGVIIIPHTQLASTATTDFPTWIKQNAKAWASSQIDDASFIKGLQYLIANDMIHTKIKGGNLLLHIFSPNNPPELISIFGKHANPNDFVSSFRPTVLQLYPNMNHALSAYSIDSIKAAIETAKAYGNIKYIAYDNEKGNQNLSTPAEELVDPAASTNEAATLVKEAGLGFSAQPTHAILMEEYKGVDWTKVDFMLMQMQKFTKGDESFISDISTVSDWIKSKNPNTIIFVQVNTAFDDTSHIISIINSVSDKIDGVSIVLPNAATVEPLLVGIGR